MAQEEKSFAERLREELMEAQGKARHCRIAEIAAIASLEGGRIEGSRLIIMSSENEALTRKVFTLLQKAFNIVLEISMHKKHRSGKTIYELATDVPGKKKVLLGTLGSPDLSHDCCRRAYLRGAFLCAGTISDPAKSYRMEFVMDTAADAERIAGILGELSLEPKMTQRGKKCVVYLQDGEQIARTIALMDAPITVLAFENIRVMRSMRGTVGRRVNCETYNLTRSVEAAARQLRDIRYLEENGLLSMLPVPLQEAAGIRKAYPDISLNELGALMNPPCGKSGVNHRFRKISECAEEARRRRESQKSREEML